MPAPLPWTYEQGQQFVNDGHITPENFALAYPQDPQQSLAIPEQSLAMPPLAEPLSVQQPAPLTSIPEGMSELDYLHGLSDVDRQEYYHQLQNEKDTQRNSVLKNAANEEYLGAMSDKVGAFTDTSTGKYQKIPAVEGMGPVAPEVYGSHLSAQPGAVVGQQAPNAGQNDGIGLIEPAMPGQESGQRMPAGPDLFGQQMAPYNSEANAIQQYEKTGEALAAEESAYFRQQEKQQQEQLQRNIESDGKRQLVIDEQFAKLQAADKELSERKVDPNRYWADKSTGQKIMAGVALILGGFGAAKTGDNMAVKVINDAIAKDIDQQRFDIRNAQDNVTQKRGVLGDMMNLFKDERLARDAAMAQGLQVAKMRLESIASRTRGSEVKLKAQVAIAGIEQKRQEHIDKFRSTLLTRAALTAAASGGFVDINAFSPDDRKRAVGSGNEFYGLANSDIAAERLKKDIPIVKNTLGLIQQLIEIGKKGGKLSPKDRSMADNIASLIRASSKTDIVGTGAISETEWGILNKVVANPTELTSPFAMDNLKTLQTSIDGKFKRTLKMDNLMEPKDAALQVLNGRRLKK